MDDLRLNPMPPWEEMFRGNTEQGEAWKFRETIAAAERLYNQWREIFGLAYAYAHNLPEEEGMPQDIRQNMLENAYIVAPKIMSAAGDTLYQIKMENAALIRFNCRQMMEQIGFAAFTDIGDMDHYEVIQDAMDQFKLLFSEWVATFKPDDFPDEWGLFGEREREEN